MTILIDREIKARCLKPTHVGISKIPSSRWREANDELFHEKDGKYISLQNGVTYSTSDMFEICASLTPITDELIIAQRWKPMITPFSEKLSEVGKISHGLSSFGYDATCSNKYKIVESKGMSRVKVLDPKKVDPVAYRDFEGDVCIIPPHGFALTNTNEVFDMPEDILSVCMAKSTYARIGLVVGVTPLEPGWRGQVTIELSNTTDLPIKVYSGEGICQFLFFQGRSKADIPYNKRGGKYMDQEGIVLPKVLQR